MKSKKKLKNVYFPALFHGYFSIFLCIIEHHECMWEEIFWSWNIRGSGFLQEIIYGLSKGRCGVLKVQLCPSEMSYISPQSQYFDSEYKHWTVNNGQNLSSNTSLEYKIRRSSEKIREEKNETSQSIQLPAEILALFDLFNAVSQRYDIWTHLEFIKNFNIV